jgi:hypothetical protein
LRVDPNQRVSLSTTSGVDFNFIKNTVMKRQIKQRDIIRQKPWLVNRKYSITRFSEMGGLACPKYNPEFAKNYKQNPKTFFGTRGECSNYAEMSTGYIKAFR